MDQEATKNVKSNLGNNVLSIMTAQRDRLRVRVEELELELSAQKQQNALLQSELDNAHQDNVKMYGKIKFLQSYQNKKLQPVMFSFLSYIYWRTCNFYFFFRPLFMHIIGGLLIHVCMYVCVSARMSANLSLHHCALLMLWFVPRLIIANCWINCA